MTTMMSEILFTVPTPLGFSVRTTKAYWELIQRKHPEIIGKESEVQQCLRTPSLVRRSTQDPLVYLQGQAWRADMAHIRVIHDPVGETLNVYWKEPSRDQICEETGEGVILIKDRQTGEVIGF